MKNYVLENARFQLEEAALKYGEMCADQQKKPYDTLLEIALHHCARSFYEASKASKGKAP